MNLQARERRIPVYVVLAPQTLLLDVAGPLEVLCGANRQQSKVRFDVARFLNTVNGCDIWMIQ